MPSRAAPVPLATPGEQEARLLLAVWREACRHIEIDASIDRIARLLAAKLPADLIVLRRIDTERLQLETAAVGSCRPLRGREPARATRTRCTLAQIEQIVRWSRTGETLRSECSPRSPLFDVLVPDQLGGDIIAGPLANELGGVGVVLLRASRPHRFGEEHDALIRLLLEPLTVALANDSRLNELVRLREASEADRRALLTKLKRQSVADVIVGADAGLREVLERVEQVAPTDAPVLIFGETGTGKEVVARAIHARSRRARGPVVRVNCGALPPGLVDSELFGHERGSFTGAVSAHQGWFERADGGTLFLDEVAELLPAAQVRLLRILQDGTFERVGAQRSRTVDVRIVAATHRNLPEMVRLGAFREDLWYRLGVFPIRLPPLRERAADIPSLAAHFASRAGERLGGVPLAPSADDLDLLVAYPWPGNVRELAAVIERAAILGGGRRLDVRNALGVGSFPAGAPAPRIEHPFAAGDADAPRTISTLDDAMSRHIERALVVTHGRVEGARGAARLLGINPHTLRARMRKLGIDVMRIRRDAGTA